MGKIKSPKLNGKDIRSIVSILFVGTLFGIFACMAVDAEYNFKKAKEADRKEYNERLLQVINNRCVNTHNSQGAKNEKD